MLREPPVETVSSEPFSQQHNEAKRLIRKDPELAFRRFLALSEAGYAPSMAELGQAYFRGRGVETDKAEAERWLRAASDAGYMWGRTTLGRFYLNQKRYREAKETYAIAAAADFAPALIDLGKYYAIVESDVPKARALILRAVEQRNVMAEGALIGLEAKAKGTLTAKLFAYFTLPLLLLKILCVMLTEGARSKRLIS